MPPSSSRKGRDCIEIACDESGSEGEKLVGGETDVFAHASVRLGTTAAIACVQDIRDRIGSPAQEYKAGHLLRTKHRAVLKWLLGPAGPIYGNAHVHLTDKRFHIVGKLAELLDDAYPARVLYRDGPLVLGPELWESLLDSFNAVMRLWNRALEPRPTMDPLLPAIVRTVEYWSAGTAPVSIVHDEQHSLTEERIAALKELINGRLTGIRFVDSRSDARVQVADFLAGVARKIASDELNNRGDAELTALLRPYVDPFSSWGDDRSWSLLDPGA